jgi:hypothetical protein
MAVPFTIDFTAPGSAGNLNATTVMRTLDPTGWPNSIRLTWLPLPTAPENIDRIEIWLSDGVDVKRILRFTDPALTTYTYSFPRSGKISEFTIYQFLKDGTVGLWGIDTQSVSFPYIHIVSVTDPASLRLPVQYWPSQRESLTQTQEWQLPAGGTEYIELAGSLRGKEFVIQGQLIDAQDGSGVTAEDIAEMFRNLWTKRHIWCYRNPRGHKLFVRPMGNAGLSHEKGSVRYLLDVSVRTVAHTEGAV